MSEVTSTDKGDLVRKGLSWSLLSSAVLRVGNFLLSILVARLIAPEEFGVFAVAMTVWLVLGSLAEFGLGSDLVRAKDPAPRAPTVATLGLLIAGSSAVTLALCAPLVARAFDSPDSAPVVAVMALALGIFGLSIVPSAELTRAYRQRALFGVYAAGLVASTVTIVGLASAGAGPMAMAWGQVACQATIVVALFVATRSRPRLGFDRTIARESLAFCLPLAMANLVSWLLITVDNLIVARELSATALGLYVLAFNVSSWPMSAVGQAIRVVALPAFADTDSRQARNHGFVRAVPAVVFVATCLGLGLATLAQPVVVLLYGERWAAAGTALAGLAVFGALRVVLDLIATFLIAAGDTKQVLAVQLIWLVAMVPTMLFAVGRWGLAGAGWAHVVVALVVVLPAYAYYLRRTGVDASAFISAWVVPLGCVVPAAVVCTVIGRRDGAALTTLAVGAAAAAVLYAGPLLPWWRRRLTLLRRPAPITTSDPQLEGVLP